MLGRSQSPVICVALAEQHRHSHANSSHSMLQEKQPAHRETLPKSLVTDHPRRKTSPRETGTSVQHPVYSPSWDFKKNSSLKNTRVCQEREITTHGATSIQKYQSGSLLALFCSPLPGAILVTHKFKGILQERIQYLKEKSNLMGHT